MAGEEENSGDRRGSVHGGVAHDRLSGSSNQKGNVVRAANTVVLGRRSKSIGSTPSQHRPAHSSHSELSSSSSSSSSSSYGSSSISTMSCDGGLLGAPRRQARRLDAGSSPGRHHADWLAGSNNRRNIDGEAKLHLLEFMETTGLRGHISEHCDYPESWKGKPKDRESNCASALMAEPRWKEYEGNEPSEGGCSDASHLESVHLGKSPSTTAVQLTHPPERLQSTRSGSHSKEHPTTHASNRHRYVQEFIDQWHGERCKNVAHRGNKKGTSKCRGDVAEEEPISTIVSAEETSSGGGIQRARSDIAALAKQECIEKGFASMSPSGKANICFKRCGEGHAILLLHGCSSSSVVWLPSLPLLSSRGYCAMAMDLPGFGESAALTTVMASELAHCYGVSKASSVEDFDQNKPSLAIFTCAVLTAITNSGFPRRIDVVACEEGVWVALYLAVLCPQKIRRLVLIDVPSSEAPSSSQPTAKENKGNDKGASEVSFIQLEDALVADMGAGKGSLGDRLLSATGQPALCMSGDDSPHLMSTISAASKMARGRYYNAGEQSGHLLLAMAPKIFVEQAIEFFSSH